MSTGIDPRLLATIGPVALRNRDARWFSLQKQESLESIASGVIGLVGVLLLGWPALGMMLFLIMSLWVGLLTDLVRLLRSPDALRASLQWQRTEEHLWALVRAVRCGLPPPREGKPLPGGPGLQLGFAFWFALAFTAALIHETSRVSEVHLLREIMKRPEMLGAMGVLLVAQLALATGLVKRQGAKDAPLVCYTPFFDVLMFLILMFFWMIISGITIKLGEVTGSFDPGSAAVTVFVLVGYALLSWRGCGELRELKEATADTLWLQSVLDGKDAIPGREPVLRTSRNMPT